MKKITGIICSAATVLLLLASLSSVIGYTASQSQMKTIESPLFAVRTAQSTNQKTIQKIHNNYLGKGTFLDIFPPTQTILQEQLEQAFTLINNNPTLIKKLFEKIASSPKIISLFQENGLSVSQVELYLSKVTENPDLLKYQLKNVNVVLPINGPRPLGLDTSSLLGCLIGIIVLLPIAVAIGVIVATATLITCLNINGCFSVIIQAILSQLVQDLRLP
jgi:hypothetical protein